MKSQNTFVRFITIFSTVTLIPLLASLIIAGGGYLLSLIGVPAEMCPLVSFGVCIIIGSSLWIAIDKKSFR